MRIGIRPLLTAVVALLVFGMSPSAAGAEPIDYDFFDGVRAELAHPGGSLPGTNDDRCRPGRDHPNPVVLVHGTGGNRQTNWATMAAVLHRAGYCVYALTYGTLPGSTFPVSALGGLTRMEGSAAQLRDVVGHVLRVTGARRVDLVGHSEGTLMPTWWLRYLGGAGQVDRYVSLAPYWKGQDSSACNRAVDVIRAFGGDPERLWPYPECNQEQYGSSFMRAINAGGSPYVPGITYTNVMTRDDGIVEPWTDGYVPGPTTTNVVVQDSCRIDRSDHLSIVSSPRTAQIVLNALDPDHRRPVPCLPVAPGLGA
ncbi:esterase/lipase family protein [Williamsia sterculiae]|uniref:Lipase (Class 2) n=1 Tax=Williamsia sterculiae TaxID=1344003 RepID=A0A1N7GY20_9NOCA|nr:alpha/beta fold hydrolase [Williamsia sterculiae]SIS17527.1 Lipase (class 2) [Williamsia sterculiae]